MAIKDLPFSSKGVVSSHFRNSTSTAATISFAEHAPSHRAKLTVEFLQQNVPNFIEPSVWPPNSPDLNPVDYAVWGALQQAVYRSPIVSLVDLKNRVRTCWASLDQQFINKAVDQWRPRLQAVIRAHGGHIEQLFT